MHKLGVWYGWPGQFDLEICAPQCMLLQCGSGRLSHATVALLGRFLPRLGPLPKGERPFFFRSLGGSAVRPQLFDGNFVEPIGEQFELAGELGKRGGTLIPSLVHIARAIDLKLNGMQSGGRIAVMLGDEATRVRLVAAQGVTEAAHTLFDDLRHYSNTAPARAIAEHHIRAGPFVAFARSRRPVIA